MNPDRVVELARQYVAGHRPYCHVAGLLEDADDYLVCVELNEPEAEFPAGPGPILVSKTTGEVWTLGSAEGGNPRWDTMRPVRG